MLESNPGWEMPPPWRLRRDLSWIRREQSPPARWIVFDPVRSDFLMLSEIEASVAVRMDGRTSMRELATGLDSDGCPYRVSDVWLMQFIERLRSLGVLLGPHRELESRSRIQLESRSRDKRVWRCFEWLQVRIPLLDPSWALDRITPWFSWVFHRAGRIFWTIALLLTLVSLVQVWPKFLVEAPYAASSLFSDRWWFLLCILVLTKVAHELGHAIACHAFGARCREMGVMVLFGFPCLYCDVTDAWRIGYARQRAMIAAAGVYVELMVAMAAYWVWGTSQTPEVRLGALQVCLSSTVVTLLLNGNPLMRYDGYYVISDLFGISNLSERARENWTMWRNSWGHSKRTGRVGRKESGDFPGQASLGLVAYHAASTLYRWFVMAGLLMTIRSALLAVGIETPSPWAWIGFVAISWVAIAWSIGNPPSSGSLGWLRHRRWRWMAAAMLVVGLLLLPLPQFHTARGALQPDDSHPIHASIPAFLVECLHDGAEVNAGDVLMRLDSPEIRKQALQIEAEWSVLESRIQQLQRRAVDDPAAPSLLAEATQQREGLQKRRTEFAETLEKLVVRSPIEGRMLYARDLDTHYPEIAQIVDSRLPLHELSKDRLWVERGTLLAHVQPPGGRWKLQATVSETELASVPPGLKVLVRVDQSPRNQWNGTVDRIEVTPQARPTARNANDSSRNLAERKDWLEENRILGADFRVTVWIRDHNNFWSRDGHGTLGWRDYSVSGWDWLCSRLSTRLALGSETKNLEPHCAVESKTRTDPLSRWTIDRTRNKPSPVPGFFLSNSSPAR